MSSRTRTRHLTVVALSAALLLGACDNSGDDLSSLDLTSPEEHTAVNTSQTQVEPEESRLTSIPRVEEDRTTDRYLPPNAVIPEPGNEHTPPAVPTTSSPENGGGDDSEDDGFPTATPSETESAPSEPSERPESSLPSGESSRSSFPSLPSLTLPDRGAGNPSGEHSSTEANPDAPSSTSTPSPSTPTEESPSAEPDEEDRDTNAESAPTRAWVPVEPSEKD